ncbi:LAMI_0E12772g1_1 [Lachancea mirantina]|uniref:LAMI_0E12772g1_1 n=1 Tax=Lachancea mirantina TaxID=1230905 RepID=A0A1G4JQE8_9SACH|nr:LAMI_0E12772g1_1 [Lachancea mirantina]
MFVSPPPANSSQAVPGLLLRRKTSELATVPEGAELNGQNQLPTNSQREFVNAPPEFANRARDEIRRRLLAQKSVSASRSHSDSDAGSIYSAPSVTFSEADSGTSSLFSSHPSLSSAATTAASSLIKKSVPRVLTLAEALPKVFYDMYSPEILMNQENLLCNGRPKFTKRELLDWDLNDIRSLLIVERLRPEWGNQLPIIDFSLETQANAASPKFQVQLLPLNSPDEFIIQTLSQSDLYLEANLPEDFKLTSAKYTVAAARKRHEQLTGLNEPIMHLTKPEWRNIIENYLLNVAVQAQCRFDFKKKCTDFKKWKQDQLKVKKPDMPPPSTIPPRRRETSLLKRTLLKNTAKMVAQEPSLPPQLPSKVSLTREEKAQLWSLCQAQVYQRLGLDWTPDGM